MNCVSCFETVYQRMYDFKKYPVEGFMFHISWEILPVYNLVICSSFLYLSYQLLQIRFKVVQPQRQKNVHI